MSETVRKERDGSERDGSERDGSERHGLERALTETSVELEERNGELKHLLMDLALKDEFAAVQQGELERAESVRVQLDREMEALRLHAESLQREIDRLKVLEAELAAVKARPSYRLMEDLLTRLSRFRLLSCAGSWAARRVAARRG